MKESNFNKRLIDSFIWKLGERLGNQAIQLLVSIVLARLLSPKDNGTVAIIASIMAIFNVIIETGFLSALIQKKNADEIDFNTIFVINLVISTVFYISFFLLAPGIAEFYSDSRLTVYVRVYSIILIINSITVTQVAKIYRKMQFKENFRYAIIATLVSGFFGIAMALMRFGAWSIILQQVSYKIVYSINLIRHVDQKPRFQFSRERAKSLMRFNLNILGNNLINVLYMQAYNLVIGRIYSSEQLAFYSKAEQFPAIIATNTDYAMQGVLLSGYSKLQDEIIEVKRMMRRSVKISFFFIFPMMIGLASAAESLVSVVLTDKWLPCVPFLQFFCINYSLQPSRTASMQAMNGIGKSEIGIKLALMTKVFGFIVLMITSGMNMLAIAVGSTIVSIFSTLLTFFPNKKYLKYNIKEQIIDILPVVVCTAIMYMGIRYIPDLHFSPVLALLVQVIVGIVIYLLCSVIINGKETRYMYNVFKSLVSKE
jgi:O-antigen/teichoic acid export membrane protein